MAKDIKETQFFNEHFERGIEWYKRFFEHCGSAKARGEISNRYIFSPQVAQRIKQHIPDCKILICLRNPYDRIQSVYSFKLREGVLSCSFEEALRRMPELIEENRYYSLIKPYLDLFGEKAVFFVRFTCIANRPLELCRELFRFLGIDEVFVPLVAEEKVNQAIVPRFPLAAVMTKTVARAMRAVGVYKPLTWAKRSDRIKGIFFKEFGYQTRNLMTERAKAMIDSVVLPEIEMLENLLNMDFSTWKSL